MDTAMGYDGYAISDNHIYISFDGMRETKSKINHAIEEAKNQRDNISRAIESLQVPDNVLRGYGNDLVAIKNAISKGIEDLFGMSQHIDYVVRRFQEVDNECATSFSKAGCEMQEMLGIARKSGLFEEFVGGLVSVASQGFKALGYVAGDIYDGAKDLGNRIGDWYEDNKVVIGNVLNIALETLAIAGAVVTIAAGALTPVGWIVIGAGLIISASNIIDSGVKIYNYQKTGEEKGFNLIEKGFQAVLGDQAGSKVYTVASIASGVYNLGKGAVTIVSQAKKFYTSVKGVTTTANVAQDILKGSNKLGNVSDAVNAVSKLDNVDDAVKGTGSLTKGIDFVEDTGRLGGKLYSEKKLGQLGKYLEKRGVTLKVGDEFLPVGKGGGFNAEKGELLLRSNPTEYEVWHELSHYTQYKKLGKADYLKLPRTGRTYDLSKFNAPEQYVYDMLSNPRRWNMLNKAEQAHANWYITEFGGIR